MERRTLTIYGVTAATLAVFGCGDFARAGDSQPADQTRAPTDDTREAAGTHGPSNPHRASRHRKVAESSKQKSTSQKDDPTKAPWFQVDPDRATVPSGATNAAAAKPKSSASDAKWAKDRFDFGYKVNGSNDFRMLPRFDINESPPGVGGQVGVNLHF